MVKRRWSLIALLPFFLLASASARSAELQNGERVTLEAAALSADHRSELFEGVGDAIIRYSGLTLQADRVWYDRRSDYVGADGKIVLEEEGNLLEGDDLVIRMEDRSARLRHGHARFAGQTFRLAGEEIARVGDNSYRIVDGTFTVCSDDPPAWKFGASRVDVELGGYARAKHVVFYLHDVPVFYLPYFLYPAKTERESGFLVPHFGYSQRRGWEVGMAYYQVLGRNMDATLFLDTFSLAGIGKGAEYRYIFGDDNAGTAALYHVSAFEGRRDVHAGRWRHAGTLPARFRLNADMEFVSDRDYLTDYATATGEYNRDLIESYFNLSRGWEKGDVALQGVYAKDFSETASAAPSHLPELFLSLSRQRIARTPFYWQFDMKGDRVVANGTTVGDSLLARPELAFAVQPSPGIVLDGGAWGEGYLRRYGSGGREERTLSGGDLRISSYFDRVYVPYEGSDELAVRHSIEPEIGYRVVQTADQETIELQSGDIRPAEERLVFALTNRLNSRSIGREGSAPLYLEWLYLKFSESYYLKADPLYGQNFSPLRGEIVVRPFDWLSLAGDGYYVFIDEDDPHWESISLELSASRERVGEISLNYVAPAFGEDEYLAAALKVPIAEQFKLSYQGRLAVEEGEFLEHLAAVDYFGQCWSVGFSYRERPGDREILVNFNLAGLGRNTGFSSRGGM